MITFVSEIFCHRQSGESYAQPSTGRFIHLTVNEGDLGLAQIFLVNDAGLTHFLVKIVALTRPFADAGKNRKSTVALRDVVDQFQDDDGLADTSATEAADFAAFGERTDQVNDFNSGFKDGGTGILIGELRSSAMNRITFCISDRAAIIDRIAGNIEDASESPLADWYGNRVPGVVYRHSAL